MALSQWRPPKHHCPNDTTWTQHVTILRMLLAREARGAMVMFRDTAGGPPHRVIHSANLSPQPLQRANCHLTKSLHAKSQDRVLCHGHSSSVTDTFYQAGYSETVATALLQGAESKVCLPSGQG